MLLHFCAQRFWRSCMRLRHSPLFARRVLALGQTVAILLFALASLPLRARAPQAGPAQEGAFGPRIWLRDAQPIAVNHVGATKTVQALSSAQPLALAKGDFDADGVEDLVIGYKSAKGGILALHRGNLDAFAPQSEASFQAIARGEFPSPFLPDAKHIE